MPHPWKYSRSVWMRLWSAWCSWRWPCLLLWVLDTMTFKSPFQPKLFDYSMILWYVTSCGSHMKSLATRKRETLCPSLKRVKKSNLGVIDPSASAPSSLRSWKRSSWKTCQDRWKTWRWLHSQHSLTWGKLCLINLTAYYGEIHRCIRAELWMSFTWNYVRPLTRPHITLLSLNWGDTGSMDALLGG